MDILWSPWRLQYVQDSSAKGYGCIFCILPQRGDDGANYIVFRGRENYIVLNLFPYTTGHVLIVPFAHIALLSEAAKAITDEMMELAKQCQKALASIYKPDGFNLGMNLGGAAGAGVAEHFHLHLLPRWIGDTNFMTAVGETRVLSESLQDTYRKLRDYFQSQSFPE